MTIIISPQDAESPRIGYENLFESATSVIASSEAAGFPKENAYDWRLYDWWKPATTGTHYLTAEFASAVTADYLAVFGHDLHKWGASAQLQYGLPAQNLLTYSEQFDNAAWVKVFGTITATNILAPDNTYTGETFTRNAVGDGAVNRAYTKAASSIQYTYSIFLKAATTNYAVIQQSQGSSGAYYYVNLITGEISQAITTFGTTPPTGLVAQITKEANDFVRCSLTFTTDAGTTFTAWAKPISVGTGPGFETANTGQSYHIWGGQLEQAAQVGPYIKTEATPITSGTAWLDATTAQAPTTGKVIFTGFDPISAAKWRVKLVTPTGPASIGHAMFGNALIFPRGLPIGFEPSNLARKNEYLNNQGDTGAFLGRSLRRYGAETSIDLKLLDPAWVREKWHPFQKHAEKKPFVFSWDYLNHPDEAAFCWTDGDVPAPKYEAAKHMAVSMKVKALTELA